MSQAFRALLYLRRSRLLRRSRRRLENLKAYLHWQAVIIYLYAVVIFLGAPLYHIALPWLLPETVRFGGGLLLALALLGYLLWSGYRALFGAADGFPEPLPVGDVRFVLTAPVSRGAFLRDRLLWGCTRAAGQALLLFPVAWFLGRAFLPPWSAAEAARAALLFAGVQLGVQGTGLLLYGLPRPVRSALRGLRTALRLAGLLLGIGGLALARGGLGAVGLGGAAPALGGAGLGAIGLGGGASALGDMAAVLRPGALSLYEPVAALIGTLLPAAGLWAAAAWLLALAVAQPDGGQLADDLLHAEQRRVASASGDTAARWESGVARTSLRRGWGFGLWAVVWRQLAAYRHQPVSSWAPILLSLLGGVLAPWLAAALGPWALEAAAGMPLLAPALLLTRSAAALAGAWRGELRYGQTRRLLPVSPWQLLLGCAFWPTVATGLAAVAGTLWAGIGAGWSAPLLSAAILLALAGSLLASVIALHEAYMAEGALAGPREGQQQATMASMVLAGLPIILAASGLLPAHGPLFLVILAATAALEAVGLLWYLALRLRGRED